MTAQHTPGPWRVGPRQDIPEGQHVLIMAGQGGSSWGVATVKLYDMRDAEIQSANARLIAAAPDLLAALEWAVEALGPGDPRFYGEERRKAVAALTKARGL
jgi:hypothetical protein